MKKSIFLISVLIVSIETIYAQNIFPPTGNAGIGTLSPAYDIDILKTNAGTTGINMLNNNPLSRSLFMAGEGNAGRYIYMGYLNSTYNYGTAGTIFDPATAIISTGATNGLRFNSATYMTFVSGGINTTNERMRITSTGNIGIGTSTPLDILHIQNGVSGGSPYQAKGLTVEGDTRATIQLLSGNTSDQYLMFGRTSLANRAWIGYNHATNEMNFTHFSTAGKFIFDNGYVGIGSANPTARLHVVTDNYGVNFDRFGASNVSSQIFMRKANGSEASPTSVANSDVVGYVGGLAYNGTSYRSVAGMSVQVDGNPSNGNISGRLTFLTTAAGASTPTERMRITNLGYVGIGTGSTVNPDFNLQIHGTTDYISPSTAVTTSEGVITGWTLGQNYGKTSRFGMTNTTSGLLSTDGMCFRMSDNSFYLDNQEGGSINLNSQGGNLVLSGGTVKFSMISDKVYFGNPIPSTATALLNVQTSTLDNGIFVKTQGTGKFGLSLKVRTDIEDAMLVYGTSSSVINYKVTGGGRVFANEVNVTKADLDNAYNVYSTTNPSLATFNVKGNGATTINYSGTPTDNVFVIKNSTRKLLQLTNDGKLRTREVIVDLVAWPDYVFQSSYSLMPLTKVEEYIKLNVHLPNVKSAEIIESEGLGLGEMNKVLMEKVEELTLYLIDQQKMIDTLKTEVSDMKTIIIKGE